ncbi:cytochrome P450 [Mycena rosella]|uniref:Cytochrome P450 n=1 Tax=Mycena rosella TaxID=1033263 RepID=A0AAD7E106_MYCRO|nr:cytochrome P450 [Mycena rosella]
MTPTTVICALLVIFIAHALRTLLRRLSSALDNIPGPPRKSLLIGNLAQYHDPDGWEFQKELEETYGQVVKLHGLFGARELYVFDPAALQSILVKDQDLYEEMPEIISLTKMMFGPGIFSTTGDDHRKFRKIMQPAFSTNNLRELVPKFYEVAERARDGLVAPGAADGPRMLDLNHIFCRISLEFIGRTGIGYSFDPMLPGQEQTNQYAHAVREILPTASRLSLLMPLLPLIVDAPFPSLRRAMINVVPLPALRTLRNLVDFVVGKAQKLVSDRKAAISSGELSVEDDAKDIMSLLIKNNLSADGAMHLTDDELVASTSMIISAATDTTSSALNRMFHIAAQYPEMQEKLRAEILAAPEHLDHDALVALPYLDAFVREVLRLFPPIAPGMFRKTCEDTVLPLSAPIVGVDGTPMNTISVPKGTLIHIAIAAANHNKQVWGADALEFKPERWTGGKADCVTTNMCGIYGNSMTFIGGGRSCIGFKFSLLEIKALLCVFLRAFKFSTPDPRIKWRRAGVIQIPNIDKQSQLPILVERLKI